MSDAFNIKAIFCDGVTIKPTPEGLQNEIVGVCADLRPYNIPGNFTFTIVLVLAGYDTSAQNVFRLSFFDPEGNVIFEIKDINAPYNDDPNVPKPLNLQLAIDCRNVVFKSEGCYRLDIYVNEKTLVYSDNINVVKGGI